MALSQVSFAANLTGIWSGHLVSGTEKDINNPVYISIHEDDAKIVVIILSAIEKKQDTFSSTFVGGNTDEIQSLGVNAYFPHWHDENQGALVYEWAEHVNTIRLEIDESGVKGILAIKCDTCSVASHLSIEKIM